MCRLFGFRSVLRSQVHRSLRTADNALAVQSRAHPDGWGVAYYVAGAPHVIKSTGMAGSDHLFERVSGLLTSETVVAHDGDFYDDCAIAFGGELYRVLPTVGSLGAAARIAARHTASSRPLCGMVPDTLVVLDRTRGPGKTAA